MFFHLLALLLSSGRAQINCIVANSTLAPRTAVVPTALLTLSVNVSGFGVTRVTEVGSDDDVAMEFSNLILIVPLKGDASSALRFPNETAQASVGLSAAAVCDLRDWGAAGRVILPVPRVLVRSVVIDLQAFGVERIPFASWSGPALAMRVVAFERDASQNDCRYVAGDDNLSNSTFTNQLCAVELSVCATTIGVNMDGWQAAGLFEFRLAPSWALTGTRRTLLLNNTTFVDVVPPLPAVVATRTSSVPYEFVAINASAGAGLRFHLDANANLVRYLHCRTFVLASTGSVVQLRFAAPFDESRNADRRTADGVYNVSLPPLVRARQPVQVVDCLQPALEVEGAGSEWALLSHGFVLIAPNELSLWFVLGSTLTTTTATATTITALGPSTTAPISRATTTAPRPVAATTTTSIVKTSPRTIFSLATTSTAASSASVTTAVVSTASAVASGGSSVTTLQLSSSSASAVTTNASAVLASPALADSSANLAETASDDNMSAIIGGAVGASVGVLVLIGIAVVVVSYRRRTRPPPPSANETAMQSQSAVAIRQQYGPSPVFAPSQYGAGPASNAYATSLAEFKVAESSTYGAFTELEQGAVV